MKKERSMAENTAGLIISTAGLSSLCTLAATWIKARFTRTTIEPDPLNVEKQDKFVTRGECKNYRCNIQKQLDALGPALERIFKKLNENDRKSEERSTQLHRRLDPIIEKTAAHQAEIALIKECFVGGKKK
jgi:peptidoglycan hydrolase CwlO-like protein